MSNLTEHEILVILRRNAVENSSEHDYLPKTHTEALDFVPHKWVMEAAKEIASILGPKKCSRCQGKGKIQQESHRIGYDSIYENVTCPLCMGRGDT